MRTDTNLAQVNEAIDQQTTEDVAEGTPRNQEIFKLSSNLAKSLSAMQGKRQSCIPAWEVRWGDPGARKAWGGREKNITSWINNTAEADGDTEMDSKNMQLNLFV